MRRTFRTFRLPIIVAAIALPLLLTACSDDLFLSQETGLDDTRVGTEERASYGPAVALSASNVSTVASFDPFAGELPEGVAVDRFGNIFVSLSGLGEVRKLGPDGSPLEVVASFPLNPGDTGALGLRFDPRGTLYVAVASTDPDVNGVWAIPTSGGMERLAGTGDIVFPNDLAVTPEGTVYITDSASGAVWRYRQGGGADVWVQDESLEGTGAFGLGVPIGANGIVVTRGQRSVAGHGASARRPGAPTVGSVLVANSEKGQLVRVPILPDGSAGEPAIVVADPFGLFGLDGITADARGTIYGALNVANSIVRIEREGGGVAVVAAGPPLDFPSAVAFGTGRNGHTLYAVNFAIIHFLSDPPMPGNANPAVLAIDVGPPGSSG